MSSHPRQDSGLSVLFLLDASSSMNERAGGTNERKITVLSRGVQAAAGCLADQDELMLVTFSGDARLAARGTVRRVRPMLGGLWRRWNRLAGRIPTPRCQWLRSL